MLINHVINQLGFGGQCSETNNTKFESLVLVVAMFGRSLSIQLAEHSVFTGKGQLFIISMFWRPSQLAVTGYSSKYLSFFMS